MQYKIVFTDLDGTLLSRKKDISDFTATHLRKLQETIPVILVSARMPKAMAYVQSQIDGTDLPLICYNGALIMRENNIIFSKTIEPSTTYNLYESCLDLEIKLGLYHLDEWYTETVTERIEKEIFNTKTKPSLSPLNTVLQNFMMQQKGFHKIMCMGTKEKLDLLSRILDDTFSDSILQYRSNDTIIELSPQGTSKFKAIENVLQNLYQLSLSDSLAFGDNFNDIEMLRCVGHGVAMANAREEVRQVADAVAGDYQKDGVAKYVKQMFNL
ncbi:HAD family hydrolase [Flavobacteriaceae bacterium M23B6Z8]